MSIFLDSIFLQWMKTSMYRETPLIYRYFIVPVFVIEWNIVSQYPLFEDRTAKRRGGVASLFVNIIAITWMSSK